MGYFLAFMFGALIGASIIHFINKRVDKSIKEEEHLQKEQRELNKGFLNN